MLLAARGARESGGGIRPVEDEGQRAALRRRARGVYVQATGFALLATALAWFLA